MATDPFAHALPILTEKEKERVRLQLERLLLSTHFRHSKRYPALLRYIVEETLAGRGSLLKERTLGVEVFGRPADYDTASDPIVRVTVAEIRKRIAQYYHEEAHASEVRIELNPGSYLPEFLPARDAEGEAEPHEWADKPLAPLPPVPLPAVEAVATAPEAGAVPVTKSRSHRRRMYALATLLLLLFVAAGSFWAYRVLRPTAMDRLWAPFFASQGPITFCIPMASRKIADGEASTTKALIAHAEELTGGTTADSFVNHEVFGENVVFSDVLAVMRLQTIMQDHRRLTRLRLSAATNLNELREGPTVFIGGLDNPWTLKLLDSLRYRFSGSDRDTYYILDTKNPTNRQWVVHLNAKLSAVDYDYALIARIHSDTLGQVSFLVAGIGSSGTAAAGEFLANPEQVRELERRLGKENADRDFEAVLGTHVDNGLAGPAEILALDVR